MKKKIYLILFILLFSTQAFAVKFSHKVGDVVENEVYFGKNIKFPLPPGKFTVWASEIAELTTSKKHKSKVGKNRFFIRDGWFENAYAADSGRKIINLSVGFIAVKNFECSILKNV